MMSRATSAADHAAAKQAVHDRLIATMTAPTDEYGASYILDHYQEMAVSLPKNSVLTSAEGTPWQNRDLLAEGQMDFVVKTAKRLGRTFHYAILDTSDRPADGFKDPVGFRRDISSNHTDEPNYELRLRDHSSLIHQQLFSKEIGLLRPLTEAKLGTWSLHRMFTTVGISRTEWVFDALKHILTMDHGADFLVVNMSFGAASTFTDHYDKLFAPFQDKPVLLFAAAGNSGAREGDTVGVPARSTYVTSIAAHDKAKEWASFSSRGNRVDLIGPGEDTPSLDRDNNPVSWSGTSSSSPLVAAVAACVGLVKPEAATQRLMKKLLTEAADDLGPIGHDVKYGFGWVNLADYVAEAPDPGPENPEPPKDDDDEVTFSLSLRSVKVTPTSRKEGRKLYRGQTALVDVDGEITINPPKGKN